MDAKEAIGILRGDISPSSVLHRGIAEKMGANALEFQEWFFGQDGNGWLRGSLLAAKWNGVDVFFDYAFAEWLKEKHNGH